MTRFVLHALGVWLCLALTSAAHAATAARLLARYQPVTYFDAAESFRPTPVGVFIADARLERFSGSGWIVEDQSPITASLPLAGTGTWRLNQRACTSSATLGGLSCYASAWKAHAARSVVYGRIHRAGQRVLLQYWYFFYDNVYSYAYPPNDFIWQAHEGDWEVVNVLLGPARRTGSLSPRFVGYSEHCTGTRRAWRRVRRWRRTHPTVYVAAGSHAGYFSAGAHPIAVECLPPQAVTLLQQNGLALPVDRTGAAAVAGPPALGAGLTSLVRMSRQRWLRFPGTWGEEQYLHGPAPIGTAPFGSSPVGPRFQKVWRRPFATLASWPAG